MGLVLSEGLPEGQLVRVTRGDTTGPGPGNAPNGAAWEGLEARVAHASPLPDGHWRIGLAFAPSAPSAGQLWCTRLVLAAVFLMAAWPALAEGAILLLPGALGAVVLILAAGAEWQYRSETRAYRTAHAHWQAPQVALQPQALPPIANSDAGSLDPLSFSSTTRPPGQAANVGDRSTSPARVSRRFNPMHSRARACRSPGPGQTARCGRAKAQPSSQYP